MVLVDTGIYFERGKKRFPSPSDANLLSVDGGRQRADIPSKSQEIGGCYENIPL